MSSKAKAIHQYIISHPCYSHPVFQNWAQANPEPAVIGALFHQIRKFCDSTRPGLNFPEALDKLGLDEESKLQQEIIESESGHGPELAMMAGYIINKAAGKEVIENVYDQLAVEKKLKEYSDMLLEKLPGYQLQEGLTAQTSKAIDVFLRREKTDEINTWRNIGATIALETISHNHLIPGEKLALIDSNLYDVDMEDNQMHYLKEHWGELGAEAHHEENAFKILDSIVDERNLQYVMEGVDDFLTSVNDMWNLLDSALLCSGANLKVA